MITKDREYLSFEFLARQEGEGMFVDGQAAIFDRPAEWFVMDGVKYYLVIDSHALDRAEMGDVVLNIEHGGKPAAKTRNGTLKLDLRPDGLYVSADLSQNVTGRELFEEILKKFYDRMSFAFGIEEVGGDSYDQPTHTRTVLRIKRLWDVAAVTWAVFEQTQVSARAWVETQHAMDSRAEVLRAAEVVRVAEAAQHLERLKLCSQILAKVG